MEMERRLQIQRKKATNDNDLASLWNPKRKRKHEKPMTTVLQHSTRSYLDMQL